MKRRWTKQVAAAALAAALALTVTACGSSSGSGTSTSDNSESAASTNTTSSDASTLNMGLISEPNSFDPAECNANACTFTVYDCYDSLLTFSEDGTELDPCLAESWEQVDDTTYTYKIREDVKFSDGNPMTMDDVLYSMNRVLNPDENYSMSYLFAGVDSFEADPDTWTLTVHLKQPDSTWKYVPATSPCFIVEKAVCEQYGDEYGSTPENTVGTGPYKLSSWEKASQITMVKNENYWGDPATVPYDTVNAYIMSDDGTVAMAAKNGSVDFAYVASTDVLPTYEGINYDMNYVEGTTTSFLALNCQVAPFDDVNVRRAVAYCIDSASVLQTMMGDAGSPLGADLLTDNMLYQNPDKWKEAKSTWTDYTVQDYDKAKECLAQTDYPDGFEFTCITTDVNVPTAELLQSMLAPAGITMNIEKILQSDNYTYAYGYNLDESGHRPYQAYMTGWISDYLDPVGQLRTLLYSANIEQGGANRACWSNADFDALLDDSYLTTDEDKRTDDFIAAAKIVNDECPYIPLYARKDIFALNPAKGTASISPQWFWNFTYMDFKPAE